MTEDNYEILPHKLLEDLKYDVESLKDKLTRPDQKSNELILEIESLKDSIHELNNIFDKALEQTRGDDVDVVLPAMQEKLNAVVKQNEIIAKGMIAISDKLEEFMSKQYSTISPRNPNTLSQSAPMQHNMGLPPTGMARTAPRFESPPMLSDGLPPPPPTKKPRHGLFR